MKKIKGSFLSKYYQRLKVIIFLTIVAMVLLTTVLLLVGCNAGWVNLYSDVGPTWSPDGSKIAFISAKEEEKFDIWIMNNDGSNLINLTGN